jgi:hypothetical protein
MVGRREELSHGSLLDHFAAVHDDHARHGFGDDAEIVGDEQDRCPKLFLQIGEELEDLRLIVTSSAGRRLVGDDERRDS